MIAGSERRTTEVVTLDREPIGTVTSTPRGHEAYGPAGDYLATYQTRADARRALIDRHHDALAAAHVEG